MHKPCAFAFFTVALALAGCHGKPAYVGTYRLIVTDEMERAFADAADNIAAAPKELRDQGSRSLDNMENMTLTLHANHTWVLDAGEILKGTYRLTGDTLSIRATDEPARPTQTCTFNQADGTITFDKLPRWKFKKDAPPSVTSP